MDMEFAKRIGVVALGGLTGGVIGYFVGRLIIDSLRDKERDPVGLIKEILEDGENKIYPNEPIRKGEWKPVDYSKSFPQSDKEELTKLASKYSGKEKSDYTAVIALEVFAKNDPKYVRETVTYYTEDTTFALENDEKVENPERMFGANVHLHFGELSEDPDVVYIANEKLLKKFEIIRIHDSYASAVLGEEKVKPKPRRRHVKKVKEITEDEEE